MKISQTILQSLFVVSAMVADVSAAEPIQISDTLWLGQKPPGTQPKQFAPDLVSLEGRYEFGVSFSPDLREMYFTALDVVEGADTYPQIYHTKLAGGRWTKPEKANFTQGKMAYELVPYVSLNEDRVYFTAREANAKDSGIWYVSRNKSSQEAKRWELSLNTGRLSDFNQARNGDLIFTNMKQRKMYIAENNAGHISPPRPMDIAFGIHGFMSPDNDYLLVNARHRKDASRKDSDLFVYFRKENGGWSEPVNLGTLINTPHSETVPRVTPDGKYLFFGRYNEPGGISNIYWVSTSVIDKLKTTYFEGLHSERL
ncbi:hypothetical protein [Pseudoalteromonas sp. McH1-42]|uniref:hypothetical protein n=1 Tax=Pseudoalteromonas sp. McH1-42 TaxID=2917752 RepID=UPI001EF73BA1|nr:hypothetical protein [Pseudoalteromonas sp. McH1-42]MCG7561603.1 hypothetical protein [Pseudoalteromonas sp. McH1-42]